jgi:hypothetical protein
MVLLKMIIRVAVGPVRHLVSKDGPDGTWVGIVAIRGEVVRDHSSYRPGGAEERLGGRETPRIAQPRID